FSHVRLHSLPTRRASDLFGITRWWKGRIEPVHELDRPQVVPVAIPETEPPVPMITGALEVPLHRQGHPPVEAIELPVVGHTSVRSEEHTSELQSRENIVC